VERRDSAARRDATILGEVRAVALAREAQPLPGELNSTGGGLAEVLRAVLEQTGSVPGWVVCDLNGEGYRSYEWGLVRARLGSSLEQVRALWHPAQCFGDLRAAGPPVHAILACEAYRKGYAPGSPALLFAGADEGERGACLLAPPTKEGE
jgi:3-oxoacyl-[acyl-carrier-protein] synthase-1